MPDEMENSINQVTQAQTSDSADVGGADVPESPNERQKEGSVNSDDTAVYSEKNSFKLVVDNGGRKKVVSNYPDVSVDNVSENTNKEQEKQIVAPRQTGVVEGLSIESINAANQQMQVNAENTQAFLAPNNVSQEDQVQNEQVSPIDYYKKVEDVAKKLTLQELGITQDDLEMAEYSDDKQLQEKANAYKSALDFNRNRVIADVERIKQEEAIRQRECSEAIQEVVVFTEDMRKKEPNFDEIDKFMGSRLEKLPYVEAVNIIPVIKALQNRTITRAQLPILQKYFEDTRLEYYARKNNVGRVATMVKPPVLENAGVGNDVLVRKNDVAKLGTLPYRDKIKAVRQMFNSDK